LTCACLPSSFRLARGAKVGASTGDLDFFDIALAGWAFYIPQPADKKPFHVSEMQVSSC
jgi:hypothetical protein